MIQHPLYILIISRNRKEIETIKSNIRHFAPHSIYVIAGSEAKLKKRLHWGNYHLVICDQQLPANQALKVNMRIRILMPHLPFILICDTANLAALSCPSTAGEWNIKASLDRSQLAVSCTTLRTIYLQNASTIEKERKILVAHQQKQLILQKFEALLGSSPQQTCIDRLKTLSRLLFSRLGAAENVLS